MKSYMFINLLLFCCYSAPSLSCAVLMPEWGVANECRIHAFNRTSNLISLRFTLKRTINECKVHFKMLKRGGWHPFLYAMTVDICDFHKHPRRYIVPKIMYSYIEQYISVRHPCPYKAYTEINLLRWSLDGESIISRFPIDFGEYGIHTSWILNNTVFAQINGSIIYLP